MWPKENYNSKKTHCKRGHPFYREFIIELVKASEKTNPTHCINGHEKNIENTYINPSNGYTNCKECRREKDRKRSKTLKRKEQKKLSRINRDINKGE